MAADRHRGAPWQQRPGTRAGATRGPQPSVRGGQKTLKSRAIGPDETVVGGSPPPARGVRREVCTPSNASPRAFGCWAPRGLSSPRLRHPSGVAVRRPARVRACLGSEGSDGVAPGAAAAVVAVPPTAVVVVVGSANGSEVGVAPFGTVVSSGGDVSSGAVVSSGSAAGVSVWEAKASSRPSEKSCGETPPRISVASKLSMAPSRRSISTGPRRWPRRSRTAPGTRRAAPPRVGSGSARSSRHP